MDGCEQYRSFLAEGGAGREPPGDLADHAQRCPACRAVAEAYRTALEDLREAGPGTGARLPDVARVLAETRRRQRQGRWVRGGLAAAAAAAAAAAVLGTWILAGGPDGPAPDPERTGGATATVPGPGPEVTGDAVLDSADGSGVPVLGTALVAEGRTVRTGEGEAVLSDVRTARVSVGARTQVRVVRWAPERSVLWLSEGSLEAQVQPRAPGEVFEVRTPSAVVRVVGTRFVVVHQPGGGTEVLGLEGEVTVETPEGALVAHVTAGRSVRLGAEGTAPVRAGILPPLARREAPRAAGGTATGEGEPVVPDALVAEARSLLAERRDAEALELLRRALAAVTAGDSTRVLAALAEAYRLAGRPVEAAAAWERCLAAGPGPAPEGAYVEYADLLATQGRAGEAARVRESYLSAWPGGRHLGRVLRDLAVFAEQDGRAEDAAELRRRLVRDAPRSGEAVEVFVDLGLRMARSGDLAGAAAWFDGRREAESRELAEAAWVGLMRVRFEEGRWEEVRALADPYRRRFPVGSRLDEVARLLRALPPAPVATPAPVPPSDAITAP